jgi:nitrogen fixation NifU-like protein
MLSQNIIDQDINDIKSLIIGIEDLFNDTEVKIDTKWNDFREIMNKNNISRKECLLLPFKTISKALKF